MATNYTTNPSTPGQPIPFRASATWRGHSVKLAQSSGMTPAAARFKTSVDRYEIWRVAIHQDRLWETVETVYDHQLETVVHCQCASGRAAAPCAHAGLVLQRIAARPRYTDAS